MENYYHWPKNGRVISLLFDADTLHAISSEKLLLRVNSISSDCHARFGQAIAFQV